MIDAHAHLLSDKLNASEIILNMKSDGLEYIVNIGTNIADSVAGVKLAKSNSKIYTTVGIHPEYAENITLQDLGVIEDLLKTKNSKIVAVGEIGLDYHYNITEDIKLKQKEIFIYQLKLANKYNLPVVIHCRDAADDILQILTQNKHLLSSGVCMHCYSEGAKYLDKFLALGSYISFTGNITFKKVDREFLKNIPLDKIMVETDCPYLSPEPLRGTINCPKNVIITAQKIADTLQMDLKEFEKITTANTKRFFNIK